MLEFLKNYYVFMLVLMIFSYLAPKEEYKVYIQFFISVFILVLLTKPIMEVFTVDNTEEFYAMFEQFQRQIESLKFESEEGVDVFEHFFSKGEGE